jgi:DNA-binding beta-propeller fold protein YncE
LHADLASVELGNSNYVAPSNSFMPAITQEVFMSRLQIVLLLLAAAALFGDKFSMNAAASRGVLLVANKGDQSLSIIDPVTGQQVAAIVEGGVTGHEVAASPDGRFAYVPIYGNSGVGKPGTDGSKLVVIDIAGRKVAGEVDFKRGVRPHCPMFGPKDGLLYVTTEIENSVTVIDPASLKIVGAIPTTQTQSHMLAISQDGNRGYTANVSPGTVSVLDLKARKTIAVIQISPVIQRIALSTDDRLAFTADQTKPQMAVIDIATNKIKLWVPLPDIGYGAAATPDGRWLVVALPRANKVAVINLSDMKVERAFDVPASPQEVVIRPDGGKAYVSCDASGKVAAINLIEWKVEQPITAGKGADGLAWAIQK